jgi:hypothetical protein
MQLPAAGNRPNSMGEAIMRMLSHSFSIAALLAAICAGSTCAQAAGGIIASDEGGASGYQHSIERSRFVPERSDEQPRMVEEFGFSKVVGSIGVVATNLRNGLVIATQNDGIDKASPPHQVKAKAEYLLSPDKHNAMVMEYLIATGIPRDQVGGIHANTYLSGGGVGEDAASVPRVDGYASVLERVVGDKFLVAESIAWARLNNDGKSISEWVYWPAIPAKALADARLLQELTTGPRGAEYLARLPAGLSAGTVVIHHSSATDETPFEALATYDVIDDRSTPPVGSDKMSKAPRGVAVVRHFDAEGMERRLPSERLNLWLPDPKAK